MTFSKDQIQALVAEIDGVLQKPSSRLSWMSGEATQQRRVLERVRNYLVALQKHLPIAPERSLSRTDLLSYDISYQQAQPAAASSQNLPQQNAQQMLQVVMQEMAQMRSSLMQPLQADLNAMQQQRESLRQEIQQLEAQRRSHSSPQMNPQVNPQTNPQTNPQLINEFLQVLMGRLQESIPQQVALTLRGTNPAALQAGAAQGYESVEQLRSPQAQSDQLILNLDSTLRVVFEALQRDVTAYQESLAQGLDRMHSLGQQSEMMFNALITHLAQQLGREASTYLQASGQLPDSKPTAAGYPSLPPQPSAPPPTPFPGAELSPPAGQPESSVDRAIDSWLQSMSSPGSIGSAPLQSPAAQPTGGLPDSQEIDALLDLNFSPEDASAPSNARSLPEDPTDIDAALRLLQQLSTNLDSSTAAPALTPTPAPPIDLDGLDEFYELFDRDLDSAEPVLEPLPQQIEPFQAAPPIATLATEQPVVEQSGQASVFAGLEATGNFDPTDGWDLIEDQPSSATVDDRTFPEVSPTPIADSDQIHSLDDLFEELPSIAAASTSSVALAASAPTLTPPSLAEERDQLFIAPDDRYIPAAPEESLLPSADRREAPHQEFWLDDLALSRLSEDLSSLESDRAAQTVDRTEGLGEGNVTFTEARSPLTPDRSIGNSIATPEPVPTSAPLEPIQLPETAGELESPEAPPEFSAPPEVESDQSFAFSLDDLDGLDDLFEREALKSPSIATPATAAPASVSDAFGFTLEGMDDLFADGPAPTTTPIPPPDSSPPTIDEPLGFTLEGMDDLFADLPAPESVNPPPGTPEKKTEST